MRTRGFELYIPEPEIIVKGKYNRDITVEQLMAMKKELIDKYGDMLHEIEVKYDKRKDGIEVHFTLYSNEEDLFRHCQYINNLEVANKRIIYTRIRYYPIKQITQGELVYVDDSGKIIEY